MSTGAVAPQTTKQGVGTSARRVPSDDEILGLIVETRGGHRADGNHDLADAADKGADALENATGSEEAEQTEAPGDLAKSLAGREELRAALDASPELRKAWQDAQAYREAFATPAEARAASSALVDLDRLDALFFSGQPEQHAELARLVSKLDPKEFASLSREMGTLAATIQSPANNGSTADAPANRTTSPAGNGAKAEPQQNSAEGESPAAKQASATAAAQQEFFHSANASAVQSVIDAIETQVERLLPEGVSKSARGRLVREIYRDVEASLASNRQLASHLREAFRSGSLDSNHERAVVSLITARAKQALPGITKRVFNEWSSTVLATHQERRARQRATERRVDIVGSSGAANDGRRSMTPRDIDYARMSDSDILNL
jgi:hypothetical protein